MGVTALATPALASKGRQVETFGLGAAPALLSVASRMILPIGARSALRDAVRRLNTRYEPRRPIDPALRRRLEARYAPEIDRLAGLLVH